MPPPVLPAPVRVAVYSRFVSQGGAEQLIARAGDWRDATLGTLDSNQPQLMVDAGGSSEGAGVIFYPTDDNTDARHVTSALPPNGDPLLTILSQATARYAGAWTVPMRWLNRHGPGHLHIAPVLPASTTVRIFAASDKWREVTVSLGSIAFSAADVDASRTLAVGATSRMPAFLLPPLTELWGTDGSGVLAMAVTVPWFVSEDGSPRLQVFPALTAAPMQVLARAGYWREVLLRASAAATLGFDGGAAGSETFAVPAWVMRFRLPPETALWAASSASAQLEVMSCKSPRLRP